MLSVYPILISIVRDNNLVNEVRRSCDQRLWQLMTISGWNCQWCSNKVNITVTHTLWLHVQGKRPKSQWPKEKLCTFFCTQEQTSLCFSSSQKLPRRIKNRLLHSIVIEDHSRVSWPLVSLQSILSAIIGKQPYTGWFVFSQPSV